MVESESVETFQEDVKWRILYSFGLAGGMPATTQGTTIKEQEQHYIFIRIPVTSNADIHITFHTQYLITASTIHQRLSPVSQQI